MPGRGVKKDGTDRAFGAGCAQMSQVCRECEGRRTLVPTTATYDNGDGKA